MHKAVLNYVLSANAVSLALAFVLMFRSRAARLMPFFTAFLGMCTLQTTIDLAVMYHRKRLHISADSATLIYYYASWSVQILGATLIFLSIYGVYDRLMKPLRGLHRMGRLLFGWVGAVAACLAGVVIFGPHPAGSTTAATVSVQAQEGVAILGLCLLLAVSFATRPLGLTYRSRLFGTTLGLGILASATLIEAPWMSTAQALSPYSGVHLISGIGCLLAAAVWIVYFARPEPVRRVITLPTTSPFFFWNRVAEALGDSPGEVAVAGVTPEMFTPAELLAFSSPHRQTATVVEMPRAARR